MTTFTAPLTTTIASVPLALPEAPASIPPAMPPQLRVLHLINGEHFSGAERVQQLLGQQLPCFGVEPHFACVKPDRFPELCGLPAERVHCLPMRGRWDVQVVGQLQRLVARQGIDVLHAHTPRTALLTALLALRTGLPWVYHVHSPSARDSTRGLVNRLNYALEWYALRRCQRVVTVSRSLRREMLRAGVNRQRLTVVPNGVPALQPIAADMRPSQSPWRLGLIALMRPRKGVEVALEAMRQLRAQQTDVSLELIGSFETHDYRDQIMRCIERWELQSCVHCSGFTRDVPAALQRLDALLLPSLFGEGMPMVVLEALAAGVPVVATRVEGTPEVIRHGVEGYLAEAGNATCLAEHIQQLIASREHWAGFSARALQRHRAAFSDQLMAQRVAQTYLQLARR